MIHQRKILFSVFMTPFWLFSAVLSVFMSSSAEVSFWLSWTAGNNLIIIQPNRENTVLLFKNSCTKKRSLKFFVIHRKLPPSQITHFNSFSNLRRRSAKGFRKLKSSNVNSEMIFGNVYYQAPNLVSYVVFPKVHDFFFFSSSSHCINKSNFSNSLSELFVSLFSPPSYYIIIIQ